MKRFTVRNDGFVCEKCGRKVEPAAESCRDHCPYCLWGKHVDNNPGDRDSECGGLLKPVRMDRDGKKGEVIIFACEKCGEERRCRVAEDDDREKMWQLMKSREIPVI